MMKKKILYILLLLVLAVLSAMPVSLFYSKEATPQEIENNILNITNDISDVPLKKIEKFVKTGGSLTKKYKSKFSILSIALLHDRSDIVKFYYSGVNIIESDNSVEAFKKYPLYHNVSMANLDFYKQIIDKLSHIDNTFGEKKRTSLNIILGSFLIEKQPCLEMTNFLLAKGASLAIPDNKGWVSLHYASYNDKLPVEVIKTIIDKSTEVNIMDNDGITPLMLAASQGNFTFLDIMLTSGKKHSQYSLDQALLLIVKSLQNNPVVTHNASSDMPELFKNMQKIIDELLAQGANPEFQDKRGHNYNYYWSYWKHYLNTHPNCEGKKEYEDPDVYYYPLVAYLQFI